MQKKLLNINGVNKTVIFDPNASLSDVLRKQLLLTGTKVSCNDGHCGACSVILDGKLTLSCLTKMERVKDGAEIITIEGIGTPEKMHPIQLAMVAHGAAQCGYCTPGFLMSLYAYLKAHPTPDDEEIREAIDGNICRCTGYENIIKAAKKASVKMAAR